LKEYFVEGEQAKWDRHLRVFNALYDGLVDLGFKIYIPKELSSGLVVAALYPNDSNWDFVKIHDYCYERGFTIYPGKVEKMGMFRLCSLGAIDVEDITEFFKVFKEALNTYNITVPMKY